MPHVTWFRHAANPALANGRYGGALVLLAVGNDKLFAFKRRLGNDAVTVNAAKTARAYRLGGAEHSLQASGWLVEAP